MTRFELIHRNSSLRGQRISLAIDDSKPGFVIGRSRQSTLLLPTPDVSRHHCRLNCVQDQVEIVDLGSRAGTFVNRQRVSTETPVLLKHRDKLQIGKWKFRFLDTNVEAAQDARQPVASQPAAAPRPTTAPASSLDSLLNELDDIDAQLGEGDFTSLNTVTLDSIESERVRAKVEKLQASKLKNAAIKEAKQKLATRPAKESAEEETAYKSDLDADSRQKEVAAEAEKEKREERFKKLPDHLRSKGPADSTTAANEALKRFFGG